MKNFKNLLKKIWIKNIENNNYILSVNSFLDEKLIEIIEIFNMPKEEYEKTFKLKNNFLLEYNETIKNKENIKNLIKFDIIKYLDNKNERK